MGNVTWRYLVITPCQVGNVSVDYWKDMIRARLHNNTFYLSDQVRVHLLYVRMCSESSKYDDVCSELCSEHSPTR